jgi:perosamine synthetase
MIDQMHPVFGEEEIEAVTKYLRDGGWCTDFKKTRELEHMIADYIGSKYCCVVNNGTTALQIALMAISKGSVGSWACPCYTMPASPYSIDLTGGKVYLVDVEKETYNMDLGALWQLIKKGYLSGIMHVSINGRANPVSQIAEKYKGKIPIIEDACQSFGSRLNGKHLGTFGDIGVLSLNSFKIISAGQGGVLLTDNEEYYNKMLRIKDYGRVGGRGSQYEILGMNAKYTDIQSVIAIEQMKKLDYRVKKKKLMWKWYTEGLKDVKQVHFIETNLEDCSPWYYDPLVEKRDELIEYLKKNGIESQPFYPAIHKLPYYNSLWGDFKNAEYISEHGIWLPSSIDLERPTVDYICQTIKEFYR